MAQILTPPRQTQRDELDRREIEKQDRIGAIIPVYGERDSVVWILERFPKGFVDTICLVVDVPSKEVMKKVRAVALHSGITTHIIKNDRRMGIGFCIGQGLNYLKGSGHSVAVVMAGNGKDDPVEMSRLIEPVVNGEFDYVQGSRYEEGGRKENMPFVRKIFNRLYPVIWTVVTGKRCTDVTNGYRCYRLDILDDDRINLKQEWLEGYSLEYYLHYKVLMLGYKFTEVPVSKIYPYGHKGGYSKIQPLKDWWPIMSPLILLFFGVKK
jgi:dolichol-phosphate mannosyltransferase